MATSTWSIYTLGAVSLNGTQLDGANNINEDPGITLIRHRSSGNIHFTQAAVATHAPVLTFDTPEIATMLTLVDAVNGTWAAAISSPCIFYWTKKDDEKRSTGSDHLTTTINEGLISINSLTWSGEADVWMANVSVHASWDGSNNPLVYGTAALPSLAAIDEAYLGGMIKVDPVGASNSAEVLAGWSSATINLNPTVEHKFAQGHEYPGRAVLSVMEPTLEVTVPDITARSTYGAGSRHEGLVIFLRKVDTSASNATVARVADVTAQHIKLESKLGIIKSDPSSASDGADATGKLIFTMEQNAANPALDYTASQAIA